MAKELPYFRFTVQDWQNGKISLESYELQGLFISICGYYWINDCELTLNILLKKYKNEVNLISELIDLGILKHEKRHDKIEIEFLNLQYDLLSEKRKLRQNAGSKGGNAKAKLKQKDSYKDKDNNKDKDKDKLTSIEKSYPTEFEFLDYCKIILNEKYNPLEFSLKAKYQAWVNNKWKDGNDKIIKNWKTKINNTIPYLKPMYNQQYGNIISNALNAHQSAMQLIEEKYGESTDNNG